MKEPLIGRFRIIPIAILLLVVSLGYSLLFSPPEITDTFGWAGLNLKGEVKSFESWGLKAPESKFGEWDVKEEDFILLSRYHFDEEGNLQLTEEYDKDTGELEGRSTFKHENGIMIERILYDAEGEIKQLHKRELFEDEEGKYEMPGFYEWFRKKPILYLTSIYNGEGQLQSYRVEFVRDSRILRAVLLNTSKERYVTRVNKYDEEGYFSKITRTYEDGSPKVVNEYEPLKFDEVGNMVRSVVYPNTKPPEGEEAGAPSMHMRKIEYY